MRNPLDLTPMAGEDAYEEVVRAMLDDDGVDALVVSLVPMTPALRTTVAEIEQGDSLAARLPPVAAGVGQAHRGRRRFRRALHRPGAPAP